MPFMVRAAVATTDSSRRLERLLRFEPDIALRRRARAVIGSIDVRPGHRVLDCGCGLGFYLHLLAQVAPDCRLQGLDSDPARLGRAVPSHERQRADLLLGNVFYLPYQDATFDRVILSEVLEHLADDLPALREVVRVLKPGGIVAITVPHQRYPWLYDPINKTLEALGIPAVRSGFLAGIWTDHRRLYRPERLLSLAQQAGLRPLAWRPETHYCLPFTHNLVYGLGTWLVKQSWLPRHSSGLDRFSLVNGRSAVWRLLGKILELVDRANMRVETDASAVNICLKATRDVKEAPGMAPPAFSSPTERADPGRERYHRRPARLGEVKNERARDA